MWKTYNWVDGCVMVVLMVAELLNGSAETYNWVNNEVVILW